jgi:diguanylate cyclase (GGDEF)-like protein
MRRKILTGDRGEIRGYVATVEDVTAETWAQDALAHRALHDALTDLPNRALLLDRLASALAERDRRGGALAVLFLDVDQFKLVNDSYGHSAGDVLLRELATRLQDHVRTGETVARLSGDEFVVLLPRVDGEDEAVSAAERIADVLMEPIWLGHTEAIVTVSVGVVVVDGAVDDANAVLRDADTAMYRAKDGGRARVEVFRDTLRDAARSRLDVSTALRGAIERDELELHYQPQIDLLTGAVRGAEALVRWNRPGHGYVSPSDFIDVAEDTGLIVDLGAWVLRTALRQIDRWRSDPATAPARGATVSVNVSARELTRPGYVDDVRRALAEFAVPASALCLELTEGAFLDGSRTIDVVQDLAGLGVRLAIDDFGTGWSSLSRLGALPVHVLKVDRSFVEGLGRDAGDRRITEAVVGLARSLELVIVAEGVETVQQEAILRSLGCDVGQGFLWSRPVRADEFLRWCEARVALPVASAV